MKAFVYFVLATSSAIAQPNMVEDGQPRAEIIIADKPTRMQRMAAHEFRQQIEKISGARLPIVTHSSGNQLKVFIGASDSSPVKVGDLKDGAYRIASGEDWLAIIGNDADFTPPEPFAINNGDIPRAEAQWQALTQSTWTLPSRGLYKNRLRLPPETGKPDNAVTAKNETFEIWGLDERGSFNGVCGYLGKLGARWYLPSELGEVLPSIKTIPLPKLNETVIPDFALRQFNFRFATVGPDTALWAMRLGMRNDERLMIAHGMDTMTGNDPTFAAHPDWFALYGNKRHYRSGYSKNQLCYSNDELFRETVRFARATFDRYPFETVSIMPPDGYTSICQCANCKGKDSPERDERGLLSDYVWDFVNRVAKEVGKTHPHRKILNCAYGVYTLPPIKIDKLEPNVQVCIVGGRRPIRKAGPKGEGESTPDALRAAWSKKTTNPLLVFENYPFTDRGWYLPSFCAHSLVDSVNATKGTSQGEDIWLSVRNDFDKIGIGFNHFLVYFTARAYWGGREISADELLRDYCHRFYEPAEHEMLAFFTYCETNWAAMEDDKAKADQALALFEKAKTKADAGSVVGRRLALVDDFLKGLRMKAQQLGQKRGDVPTLRLVGEAKGVVIDGRLDDEYWQNCPLAATGRFRELQTGRAPTFGTSFKAGWQGNNVIFGIRCDERRSEKLNITSTRNDDPAVWHGDAVELQIATESHTYYQIAISPAGHIVDLDRGATRGQWFGWDSKAQVATHIADDHWTIEISLPITADENDPLHQIIGRKPTQSLPWHINVCRQRIRENGQEYSAFSPTGTTHFHDPMKFAHFYDGRSHAFDAAEPSTDDFIPAVRAASTDANLQRSTSALVRLAEGNFTNLQKSYALELAAQTAQRTGDEIKASELIKRIPVDAIQKTARMRNQIATFRAPALLTEFATEDFSTWPFWKRGDGLHLRGRAHLIVKNGAQAEIDLNHALDWIGDPRQRESVMLTIAQNRETNLSADTKALEAYESVLHGKMRLGGADEYAALQGIARIQTRQGKFDDALKTLHRAEPEKLQGVWKTNFEKSIEDVNNARK